MIRIFFPSKNHLEVVSTLLQTQMDMKHCQPSVITFSYSPKWLPFICFFNFPFSHHGVIISLRKQTLSSNNFSHVPNGKSTIKPASVPVFSFFTPFQQKGDKFSYQRLFPHLGSKIPLASQRLYSIFNYLSYLLYQSLPLHGIIPTSTQKQVPIIFHLLKTHHLITPFPLWLPFHLSTSLHSKTTSKS